MSARGTMMSRRGKILNMQDQRYSASHCLRDFVHTELLRRKQCHYEAILGWVAVILILITLIMVHLFIDVQDPIPVILDKFSQVLYLCYLSMSMMRQDICRIRETLEIQRSEIDRIFSFICGDQRLIETSVLYLEIKD
ncbi:unnamed protein product [Owenia fusiformis]|uniref:Uncharacterized protein n=1 Tax=Owenia fusiformis TaxID=6347 RepID=A0A8S4MWY3_OWEFU|nr:unnamed protein product [Owenia fusiformis]